MLHHCACPERRQGEPRSRRKSAGGLYWDVFFGGIHIITAVTDLVLRAVPLVETHNIHSTDGVLLRMALDLDTAMRPHGDRTVLIVSDQRLLRAAGLEGLPVHNPETGDLPSLQALVSAP